MLLRVRSGGTRRSFDCAAIVARSERLWRIVESVGSSQIMLRGAASWSSCAGSRGKGHVILKFVSIVADGRIALLVLCGRCRGRRRGAKCVDLVLALALGRQGCSPECRISHVTPQMQMPFSTITCAMRIHNFMFDDWEEL